MPSCAGCSKCTACYPQHDCEECDRIHNSPSEDEAEPDNEPIETPFGAFRLIDVDYAFIFSGGGEYAATAYVIYPERGKTRVYHQYDCNSCQHFDQENCRLMSWDGSLAEEFQEALSCGAWNRQEQIEQLVRRALPDASVSSCSEALLSVTSPTVGSFYIATANCD